MALVNHSFTALINTDPDGDNTIAAQAVTVKNELDATFASIFSDSAGASPIVQPGAATDPDGVLAFFVTAGIYSIQSGSRTEIVIIDDGSRLNPDDVTALIATKQTREGEIVSTKFHTTDGDDGETKYKTVLTASVTPDTFNIIESVGNPNLSYVAQNITTPRQFGWTESGGSDNYDIIEFYSLNGFATNSYDQIYTLNYFTTQWLNGKKFPLAFYGDSTTDGNQTTSHVPSIITGSISNFSSPITINESPNSYPDKMDDFLNLMISSANLAIYNAGFDSMSLKNDFGNKAFHRVFFGFAGGLNNVDFSDVKGIAISWGTSDSINLDDIDTILDSYEFKMELIIIECFERGIQPFINDPVLNFQRTGSLVSGRQNDQSISIIESVNERLRKKYDLEKLSLRLPLENYAEKAFKQAKDLTEVISSDGIHPNDKGHTHIASWMTAWVHPLAKYVKADETYRFVAGNFYPITLADVVGTDIWRVVDNTAIVSRTSFFWRFDPVGNDDFMYRIFVFCEEPMDLTYDCFSQSNNQKVDNRISKIEVINLSDTTSRKGRFFSDNQGSGLPLFAGSHQIIARLKVGLNEINVTAPEDAAFTQQNLGYLRVEPRYETDLVSESVSAGFVTFNLTAEHRDVKYIANAASDIIWSNNEFKREEYHYTKIGETTLLQFTINHLHDREISWNANRTFNDFDTYNLLKFSGAGNTLAELFRVTPTSDVDPTPIETLLGSVVGNDDLSAITDFEDYYITINHAVANTAVIIQRLRNSTGATSTFGTITLSTEATQPYAGGYGVGAKKSATDGIPMLVNNISVDFVS